MSECSVGEAVKCSNEKHWGEELFKRQVQAFDVILLQAEIVTSLQGVIDARREEYVASVKDNGAVMARKRIRSELETLEEDEEEFEDEQQEKISDEDGEVNMR